MIASELRRKDKVFVSKNQKVIDTAEIYMADGTNLQQPNQPGHPETAPETVPSPTVASSLPRDASHLRTYSPRAVNAMTENGSLT
jgi:hypothetical protein